MFIVMYHAKVKNDLQKIHEADVSTIRNAIETKLVSKPDVYGKPLRRTLKNLWSLRVGDYRVVYSIRNTKLVVIVITVQKRDTVYKAAQKRL